MVKNKVIKVVSEREGVRHKIISAEVTHCGADITLSKDAHLVFLKSGDRHFAIHLDYCTIKDMNDKEGK